MERDQLGEQEWQSALRHADVLRRLPQRPTASDVADAMVELGVSRATLFRWLKRYRGEERVTALVGRKPGRRAGIDPLDPALKAIVDDNITKFYATPEKPPVTRLWKRISADCRPVGLAPPSIRRLKSYLATFDAEIMTRRREGKARADAKFLALPGEFSAQYPLQIVQIDHTKVDVTVVDPIGGGRFKMLRRHIEVSYGMDYPMLLAMFKLTKEQLPHAGPAYSEQKAMQARAIGLGKHSKNRDGGARRSRTAKKVVATA